jgi:hypothetical protein
METGGWTLPVDMDTCKKAMICSRETNTLLAVKRSSSVSQLFGK